MANGTDIAKAYVQIIPSAEGIKGSLESLLGGEAEASGKSAGGKFSKFFGGALKTGGAVVAGMTAAATALTGTMVAGANATAEYGDHIDKMSQKMGISAQAYQEWDAIMQHSGTSIDSMQRGMTTLAKAAENGSDAWEKLGLSQEQVASMSQEELFAATISALQDMESGTERTAVAQELLGGSAKELGALLNTSSAETEAMRQRVHELGGVMSDEAVAAAAAYQDSLQDMQTALSGIKNNMMGQFMPAITQVMDGLTMLFSGDSGGLAKIKEGIRSIASTITQVLPDIIQVGAEILVSLAGALVENLPLLIDATIQAIQTIVTGLLTPENIVLLIDAAIEIIIAITEGMIDALPALIDATVTLVTTICTKLTDPDTVQRLLAASWQIIVALAQGLIKAVPQLLTALGQVISNLMTVLQQSLEGFFNRGKEILGKIASGIGSAMKAVYDVGSNIVSGIWQGISDGYEWITGRISSWCGSVINWIKRVFRIGSPSKVMADEVGIWLAKGIGLGFEEGMDDVTKDMAATLPNMTMTLGTSALRAAPAYNYGGVTIQILGREKDADTLARELQAALERRTAVWA